MKRSRLVEIILSIMIIILTVPAVAFADGNSNPWPTSGAVGIGTPNPNPSFKLHIVQDYGPGNNYCVPIYMTDKYSAGTVGFYFIRNKNSDFGNYIFPGDDVILNSAGNIVLSPNTSGKDLKFISGSVTNLPAMVIEDGGTVGIGKTDPDLTAKLDVAGKIIAKEIRVTTTAEVNDLKAAGSIAANEVKANEFKANEIKVNNAKWSDFVFDKGYKLASLDKVESYVQENKHLPDVPSAQDIKKDGLPVADMMAKQMQKIEELTLYVIELKKENDALKARMTSLEGNK